MIFIPALVLDQERIKQKRVDIFCCFKKESAPDKPRDDIVRRVFNRNFVPFVFRKSTKVLTIAITVCLIVIGSFSCSKILRGLNQNVSLVSGSDIFDYFNALFEYGNAGPPAYVIFNNVNYTDPDNIDQMELIDAELAGLNNTIQSPIYSWVTPFKNYVKGGVWSDACNSLAVKNLPFDDQMKEFVKIEIDSNCCQKYGICGEQYSLDVVFDDFGRVKTSRFRFQHQPLKYQKDYIAALVETRKATDIYSEKLKKNVYNDAPNNLKSKEKKNLSWYASLKKKVLGDSAADVSTDDVPVVFCYSLIYVYYDQYTYITGVLSQDVMLGIVAVFVSIQVSNF